MVLNPILFLKRCVAGVGDALSWWEASDLSTIQGALLEPVVSLLDNDSTLVYHL